MGVVVELGMVEGAIPAAGITQEHFPELQHSREKLTVILIIINLAFHTFTLLGAFGESQIAA